MSTTLTFLGGVGTVTGSKYLLEANGRRILIDCGLFQGYKQLRLRNWAKFPVDPASIDVVLLTHAHIDHSGYLPLLVRNGFRGPVICTDATRDLCGVLLPDSGHLQERDADFANRHGYSKHTPALPLYTQEDGERALKRFEPVSFDKDIALPGGLGVRFRYAGHILGAAMIELTCANRKIVFSGDLGRPNDILLHSPAAVADADYVIVESTYGDRTHPSVSAADALAETVAQTAARGGTILIPAFAVGRTQELLVYLHQLKRDNRIPDLPVYLDSPMAIDASDIFCRYARYHRMSEADVRSAFAVAKYPMTREESKSLDANGHPKVIISASGMATGGRILHHLKTYAPDPRSTIVFVGFQSGGTRGGGPDLRCRHNENTRRLHSCSCPHRAFANALRTCRFRRASRVASSIQSTTQDDLCHARGAVGDRRVAASDRGRIEVELRCPRISRRGGTVVSAAPTPKKFGPDWGILLNHFDSC